LDISVNADKKLTSLLNSLGNIKGEKYDKLYSIMKILSENIDEM